MTDPAPAPTAPAPGAPTTPAATPVAAVPATAPPADSVPPVEPPPAAEAAPAVKTTDITAGQGGVMTDEVGVVTGDLTLRTELSGDQVKVSVQYQDAEEWYAVTGAKAQLKDPADLDAVHAVAVGILNRPEG
ncbi:MAG: hypothetical protein ABW000_25150 [Actinoplanes sp.]